MSLVSASTPSYWLALMLMLVFSVALGWLPAIGVGTPAHYVLPCVALGLQSAGAVARMTRASVREVLSQDFLRAARAKGVPERTRDRPPRPAQCAAAGAGPGRAPGRRAARRHRAGRERLRRARRRPDDGRRGRRARLPDGAGRRAGRRHAWWSWSTRSPTSRPRGSIRGCGRERAAGLLPARSCWPPAPPRVLVVAVVAAAAGPWLGALRSARRRPGVELPAELVGASARHRPPRTRHAEPAGGRSARLARHRPGRDRGRIADRRRHRAARRLAARA